MSRTSRSVSLLLATALATPLGACSSSSRQDPRAPVDDTRGDYAARPGPAPDPAHMSTKSKVVILAGAAALYYLYKHHQTAAATQGEEGQYYLSKNGRVYYRDAEHRAHWVTAPAAGISVPAEEANEFRAFQGYDNQTTGRDLSGLSTDTTTEPAN